LAVDGTQHRKRPDRGQRFFNPANLSSTFRDAMRVDLINVHYVGRGQ
jgi:hypothetical protein